MPVRPVPGSSLSYYLIAFDKDGNERQEAGGALLSDRIAADVKAAPPSDIFIFCHGWLGDVSSAIGQYDTWTKMLVAQSTDMARAMAVRGAGFRPLLIGLHWPSKPWGDETLGGSSFAATATATVDGLVKIFADRLSRGRRVSPRLRAAIRTIVAAAAEDDDRDTLPPDLLAAFVDLERVALPAAEGPAGPPSADREALGATGVSSLYDTIIDADASFGSGSDSSGPLIGMLRIFSFWAMKDRARSVGEGGAYRLLRALQQPAPQANVHLMGHSFGCIVVAGMIAGAASAAGPLRPVRSALLVEGALSCWSFSPSLPFAAGKAGYFAPLVAAKMVAGPLVVIHSPFDYALGRFYPLAAGVAGQSSFADPQAGRFSALGALGAQGTTAQAMTLGPADTGYRFVGGAIYNLNGRDVIKDQSAPEGAHNDIVHPEVAHAFWEAALTQ
ncbi:MAG: hypothetical protein WCI67_18875 [Chloroflexales bacterium]